MKAPVPRSHRRRHPAPGPTLPAAASLVVLLLVTTPVLSQAPGADAPWFGLSPFQGLGERRRPAAAVGDDYGPVPARVPAGEEGGDELRGERVRGHLETIVGFSRTSRAEGNRLWGRITGRPSGRAVVEWAARRFRDAGLEGVEVQSFEAAGDMWWPRSWEVRLLGDPAYGAGSDDVVLESALPTRGSRITGEAITAPLVYVGDAREAILARTDVAGKVAVQHVRPTYGVYADRRATVERARKLLDRGAAAVLNAVEQPGNMHVKDFGGCGGPCFNLGGEDATFLEGVLDRAAAAGSTPTPRVRLALEAEELSGLTAANAVGVVPGRSDENIVVNAHADGWFEAAGDNGDGLAVQVALARHFAARDEEPARTLVFVASAGHHSRGMNGPSNFVRMNPGLTRNTVLVLNLEHVAQHNISRLGGWTVDSVEEPKLFGITNEAPFLIALARRGVERYGYNLRSVATSSVPGDLGGYAELGVPRVQGIHAGPLYHTSGDVLATISVPGLERAARFYAYFVREAAKAPLARIDP